ncbi:hypothetical protein GJ744_011684 [Endocarpon pusillum]|uniref:Uncharacterized protein n=1 Tax=Endocarpon pusillum TaxID=364733 RepID=A0A8H7ACE0_9EURO|nr:hypothetical protein GJ744_011684 [Endocarpon pusillum]
MQSVETSGLGPNLSGLLSEPSNVDNASQVDQEDDQLLPSFHKRTLQVPQSPKERVKRRPKGRREPVPRNST